MGKKRVGHTTAPVKKNGPIKADRLLEAWDSKVQKEAIRQFHRLFPKKCGDKEPEEVVTEETNELLSRYNQPTVAHGGDGFMDSGEYNMMSEKAEIELINDFIICGVNEE